jgi:hypothetical protein
MLWDVRPMASFVHCGISTATPNETFTDGTCCGMLSTSNVL